METINGSRWDTKMKTNVLQWGLMGQMDKTKAQGEGKESYDYNCLLDVRSCSYKFLFMANFVWPQIYLTLGGWP